MKMPPFHSGFVKWPVMVVLALSAPGFNALADEPGAVKTVKPDTVLELFTSQGCSSCPPANDFVRQYAKSDDVLVLSYSVDYWNYMGWRDTFSRAEFTRRQKNYARRLGGHIYTPEMVLNGQVHNSRFTKAEISQAKLAGGPKVQITPQTDGIGIEVQATGDDARNKPYSIMAVRYRPEVRPVAVKAGENRGKTLHLTNIVEACDEIGKTNATFRIKLPPLKPGQALAILVEDGRGGPILAAAHTRPAP